MRQFTPFEARQLPPLMLAWMGDAVLELLVREKLLQEGCYRMQQVHRRGVGFVRATAQARAMRAVEPLLTPEEDEIFRRGRNAKSGHVRKNADMTEYRVATGFEALLGYLHITGQMTRVEEFADILFETVEKGDLTHED